MSFSPSNSQFPLVCRKRINGMRVKEDKSIKTTNKTKISISIKSFIKEPKTHIKQPHF